MPGLEDVVSSDTIYSLRSDGSLIIATLVMRNEAEHEHDLWDLRVTDSHGHLVLEELLTMTSLREPITYRKLYQFKDLQELARDRGYTEWQEGYPSNGSAVDALTITESVSALADLTQLPIDLQEEAAPTLSPKHPRRQKKIETSEPDIAQQISEIAKQVVVSSIVVDERMPSYTQQIIAQQVALGGTYYENAVAQSRQSFEQAKLLSWLGAGLFALSIILAVLPFTTRSKTTTVGVIVAAILQGVGGLSFLYSKATSQLASFHLFLDRINRASLAHTRK